MAARQMTDGTTTVSFDVMTGKPAKPQRVAETWSVPGADGSYWRDGGYRSVESQIVTRKTVATAAAADAEKGSYAAIGGQICTVTDADNVSHSDCIVQLAGCQVVPIAQATTNADHTKMLIATWTLRQRYTG